MNRVFGVKQKTTKPTTSDVIGNLEGQADNIELKINRLNQELATLNRQMQATTNPTARNLIKNKALNLLKQKKMYEEQTNRLKQQAFNLDSVQFATQNVQNALVMTHAMKTSVKALKKHQKLINIDKVMTLNDELQDLISDTNEISNLLGDQYGMDDLNEEELMLEFDHIGESFGINQADDLGFLDQIGISSNPTAVNAAPTYLPSLPNTAGTVGLPSNGIEVDEFGLPLDNTQNNFLP